MAKIYTEEHERFFKAYGPGHTCREVEAEFLRRFPDMADKVGEDFARNKMGMSREALAEEWETVRNRVLALRRPKTVITVKKPKEPKIIKEPPHGFIW